MKITFCCQTTGCGNNGGTATIFHSANVLSELGHQVNVVSDKKNMFTWFRLKGAKFIKEEGMAYPNADVILATGAGSVRNVLNAPVDKGVKFWWIRAHETWIMDEALLLSLYRRRELNKLVNSKGLQKFIHKMIESPLTVIRPGLDFDVFYQMSRNRVWKDKVFTLGALYNRKSAKRFKWIPFICQRLKELEIEYKLKLYGTRDDPVGEYDEYICQPRPKELRQLYNDVDFWIAPTNAEGLHIPPQEAMLCGCIVIGASGELNGMNDYIEQGVTGFLVNSAEEVVQLINKFSKGNGDGLSRISKAGMDRIISMGDRRQNMSSLGKVFENAVYLDKKIKRDRVLRRGR